MPCWATDALPSRMAGKNRKIRMITEPSTPPQTSVVRVPSKPAIGPASAQDTSINAVEISQSRLETRSSR
jgi:hypothetical protein